ncbi:MAG: hypothetical protein ACRCY3_01220 [Sphingorhabdus sp.]
MAASKKPADPAPGNKPATRKVATATSKTAKPKPVAKGDLATAVPDVGKVEMDKSSDTHGEFANLKDKASARAREAADRGKDKASEALGGIGKVIRDSATAIDEKVGAQYGDYARKAADAVDELAVKMDAKQVDDILEDTRQFVRKSPAVAIGAAAAIGFVLARLVRSGRD